MRIENLIHRNVQPDGTFLDHKGAVHIKGSCAISWGEGCGLDHCKCSPGYWISIILPRTEEGIVEVVRVKFEDLKEMENVLHANPAEYNSITIEMPGGL